MSAGEEVLQASEQFYAALDRFLNGDSEPMMEVWSHGPDVKRCIRPLVGKLAGRRSGQCGSSLPEAKSLLSPPRLGDAPEGRRRLDSNLLPVLPRASFFRRAIPLARQRCPRYTEQ